MRNICETDITFKSNCENKLSSFEDTVNNIPNLIEDSVIRNTREIDNDFKKATAAGLLEHSENFEKMPEMVSATIEKKTSKIESKLQEIIENLERHEGRFLNIDNKMGVFDSHLHTVDDRLEFTEKNQRIDTLIIEGVILERGLTLKECVSKFFACTMNMDVQPRDMKYVTRYGSETYDNGGVKHAPMMWT